MFSWRSAATLLALVFAVQSPPSAQSGPNITIEGLDPVRLVAGDEVQGRLEWHADHADLRYLFDSQQSRDTFLKSPDRYAVQLGGICARMGPIRQVYSPNPPVNGPPMRTGHNEIWAVHDGRIYLFATLQCRDAFLAKPSTYLSPSPPELPTGEPAVRRARELIDAAVAAMGGAAAVDAITSFRSVASQYMSTDDG